MYQPKDVVTTEERIRRIVPGEFESQTEKVIDHVDQHIRAWIERSPFVTMATVSAEGRVDVSPKGDPPGFVRVIDDKTLAVPDRPGNHRYDSFLNILETGRISLLFLVPNRREVVRVAGNACVVRDEELRASLAVEGRVPDFAVVVRVEEAFYHCGKAVIRSQLWQPEKALPIDDLPTYAQAVKDHGGLDTPLQQIEKAFRINEERRLYDE